ncbi:hypothetical protein EVAR_13674_1 [Eumeta japonica]|uniref:Uncharacterized protein n=1 Tax=Eumeta variegata TaxID=151549 RepID=A0A4C1UBK9_EUMVA|nr:hypothetical protein EVAR_13674_1 [Eumeta japonica]
MAVGSPGPARTAGPSTRNRMLREITPHSDAIRASKRHLDYVTLLWKTCRTVYWGVSDVRSCSSTRSFLCPFVRSDDGLVTSRLKRDLRHAVDAFVRECM